MALSLADKLTLWYVRNRGGWRNYQTAKSKNGDLGRSCSYDIKELFVVSGDQLAPGIPRLMI